MPKTSAGIIAFRILNEKIEILLVHPGGPFFRNKDLGVWSIPKGEYTKPADPLEVAKHEFEEETGNIITGNLFMPLTLVKNKSAKVLTAWAIQENFEVSFIRSNIFELEWPPKSGKMQNFPEADKAEWFSFKEAKQKIVPYQLPLIAELETLLT